MKLTQQKGGIPGTDQLGKEKIDMSLAQRGPGFLHSHTPVPWGCVRAQGVFSVTHRVYRWPQVPIADPPPSPPESTLAFFRKLCVEQLRQALLCIKNLFSGVVQNI